jgi:hypothetical protein
MFQLILSRHLSQLHLGSGSRYLFLARRVGPQLHRQSFHHLHAWRLWLEVFDKGAKVYFYIPTSNIPRKLPPFQSRNDPATREARTDEKRRDFAASPCGFPGVCASLTAPPLLEPPAASRLARQRDFYDFELDRALRLDGLLITSLQ